MILEKLLAQAHQLLLWSTVSAQITEADMQLRPLFGSSLPWNDSGRVTWISVDDRVRGGSSVSHLDLELPDEENDIIASSRSLELRSAQTADARFWGNLDTTTLGGAGFASVATDWTQDYVCYDLACYEGILLEITRADSKKYTFIVKDEVPGRRKDGRKESAVNFEFDFVVPPTTAANEIAAREDNNGRHQIVVPWDKMVATYRGRKLDDPRPLRTNQICQFSLMMRSFFEQQEGDFELIIHSISAYRQKQHGLHHPGAGTIKDLDGMRQAL